LLLVLALHTTRVVHRLLLVTPAARLVLRVRHTWPLLRRCCGCVLCLNGAAAARCVVLNTSITKDCCPVLNEGATPSAMHPIRHEKHSKFASQPLAK
jgi:hypothetical protein